MEDKLTLFRQQAAIISRKKESTAEKLNDIRVELNTLEEEVKDKKSGIIFLPYISNTFNSIDKILLELKIDFYSQKCLFIFNRFSSLCWRICTITWRRFQALC